jgi:hypothetical protein
VQSRLRPWSSSTIIKDAMGIDHVNPRSWKGDTCVDGVDLKLAWKKGQQAAEKILGQFFGRNVNFNDFLSKPEHDLMQAIGRVCWCKPTADDARSEEENSEPLNISGLASQTSDVEVQKTVSEIPGDANSSDGSDASEESSLEEKNRNSRDQFALDIPLDQNIVGPVRR